MSLEKKESLSASQLSAEVEIFRRLQAEMPKQYRSVFTNEAAPRTVLIVPSLSLDQEVMAKISGVVHYEERMLCLLLLLRLPQTKIVFVTSEPIPDSIVEYYLHLLQGIPHDHARRRLTMLSCHDSSAQPLTAKILARPRLLARIRQAITEHDNAHMTCFNVSNLERTLAVQLGVPIYGCDPDLLQFGSKSGSREIFREANLSIPDGFEHLADATDVAEALAMLKGRTPDLRRAVVKLNEGFSGEGNAIFNFDGAPQDVNLQNWVEEKLPDMAFEARDMTWESYAAKIGEMGAIAEVFVEGDAKRSPSAQYRIDPLGQVEIISTHDQVTGGSSGQIFLGCRFPADETYRLEIQAEGLKAAEVLRRKGVLGRFGVDFVSVPHDGTWRHYALEVNLRKGGTTHPFLMLQFLTDGSYDPATGLFRTRDDRPCYYFASDNLEASHYSGLTPEDLIEIAVENGLHFHGASQEGVVFHLIGALSEFGKVGVMCVAGSRAGAERLYEQTTRVLDREGRRHSAIGG
jgi:hypothetical protein